MPCFVVIFFVHLDVCSCTFAVHPLLASQLLSVTRTGDTENMIKKISFVYRSREERERECVCEWRLSICSEMLSLSRYSGSERTCGAGYDSASGALPECERDFGKFLLSYGRNTGHQGNHLFLFQS